MQKLCISCGKEFSTTIKTPTKTVWSLDRKRCLDCCPFKEKNPSYNDKDQNFRNAQLKRRYGIDLEKYKQMLVDQKGLCAICNNPPPNSNKKNLSVDHDHITEVVRGLLCTRCNSMLGWYEKYRVKTDLYLQQSPVEL